MMQCQVRISLTSCLHVAHCGFLVRTRSLRCVICLKGSKSCAIAPFKARLPGRQAPCRPTSVIILAAKQKQMNTIRERCGSVSLNGRSTARESGHVAHGPSGHTHYTRTSKLIECRPRARGFVSEDNSGKANIFGVEVRTPSCSLKDAHDILRPTFGYNSTITHRWSRVLKQPCNSLQPRQLYTSSPTSDLAAKQGLGGQLGLLILVGCIAAVGAASLFSREAGPQTLAEVRRIPPEQNLPGVCRI